MRWMRPSRHLDFQFRDEESRPHGNELHLLAFQEESPRFVHDPQSQEFEGFWGHYERGWRKPAISGMRDMQTCGRKHFIVLA